MASPTRNSSVDLNNEPTPVPVGPAGSPESAHFGKHETTLVPCESNVQVTVTRKSRGSEDVIVDGSLGRFEREGMEESVGRDIGPGRLKGTGEAIETVWLWLRPLHVHGLVDSEGC